MDLQLQALRIVSAFDVASSRRHDATATVVSDVLYLPEIGLQIIDGDQVPAEGIVDPSNLGLFQRRCEQSAYPLGDQLETIDEDVCILSNRYSHNFSHFTEELFKVLLLERAGFKGRYVYTQLPAFAFEYWACLGLDSARLLQVSNRPVLCRRTWYTTTINFLDIRPHPAVFFELRDRMRAAAAGTAPAGGTRLWFERGTQALQTDRGLVNGEMVDPLLAQYGFTRLDIGAEPLLTQIATVQDAEVIAGPHGSAFLHAMYMPVQARVIEVFSPLYLNGYSFEICRVLQHRYHLVVEANAPHNMYPYGKHVWVPLDQLSLALQQLDGNRPPR